MRLVSYNILNPFHAVKWRTAEGLNAEGNDNWEEGRREKVIRNLQLAQFDIACLQEISARTHEELKSHFDFIGFNTHTSKEAPEGLHGTAIVYNPNRLELLDHSHYQTIGSEYRVATMCEVKELQTNLVFRIISIHIKGYNPYEPNQQIKHNSQHPGDQELRFYISEALNNTEGLDGIAFLGDLNEDADEMHREDSRQKQLMSQGFQWDGVIDITEPNKNRKIDWIFFKDLTSTQALKMKHIPLTQQDYSASDHAITGCELL